MYLRKSKAIEKLLRLKQPTVDQPFNCFVHIPNLGLKLMRENNPLMA